MDILLLEIGAPVECAIIFVNLRPLCLRDHCHFVSGMQVQRRLLAISRSKAQTHTATRGECLSAILDAREFDFVTVSPGQMRWLIAQAAVPAQWCLQIQAAFFYQSE